MNTIIHTIEQLSGNQLKLKMRSIKEVYNKDPKFKVGDHKNFRIQILFCKGIYTELV